MNKLLTLLSVSLAAPAFAGTSETVQQYTQTSEPPQWRWFAGGSVAYLSEYEEPMYSLNAGVKSPWSPWGWNVAFFAEGGFIEDDNESKIPLGVSGLGTDLEIIPVTANVKFEKALNDRFGVYFGGGVGAAFTELKAVGVGRDSDTVFAGQAFAGVNFRIDDHSEVYAGGRWIHFDDAENYSLDNTWAAEAGYRWNF